MGVRLLLSVTLAPPPSRQPRPTSWGTLLACPSLSLHFKCGKLKYGQAGSVPHEVGACQGRRADAHVLLDMQVCLRRFHGLPSRALFSNCDRADATSPGSLSGGFEFRPFDLRRRSGGRVPAACLQRPCDPTFDERHDLLRLFAASGILRVDREKMRARNVTEEQIDEHLRTLQIAGNEVFRLWSNQFRFASEGRLRSHLKQITGHRRIKGDYLKEQARRFVVSAQRFIDKGVMLWDV